MAVFLAVLLKRTSYRHKMTNKKKVQKTDDLRNWCDFRNLTVSTLQKKPTTYAANSFLLEFLINCSMRERPWIERWWQSRQRLSEIYSLKFVSWNGRHYCSFRIIGVAAVFGYFLIKWLLLSRFHKVLRDSVRLSSVLIGSCEAFKSTVQFSQVLSAVLSSRSGLN